MASEVDICNIALGYLGDDATVASIDPPEGSAQAEHCSRFYTIARDTFLDEHQWNFCTRRALLAQLAATPPSPWAFGYAVPADMIDVVAVLANDARSDHSAGGPGISTYTPQPFVAEVDNTGSTVIYTNQLDATLRYTARVTDTAKFPPQFVNALAMKLASLLAGPVLKGETGIKAAMAWMERADMALSKAKTSDANQQKQEVAQSVSWMANR